MADDVTSKHGLPQQQDQSSERDNRSQTEQGQTEEIAEKKHGQTAGKDEEDRLKRQRKAS